LAEVLHKTKKARRMADLGLGKQPRPCRVHLVSFEHVLQHVELARLLSTSSEGMSATAATLFLDRLITVQGLVANHEQGRVNLLCISKDQL